MARSSTKLISFAAFLLFSLVKADWPGQGPWGGGDGDWNGDDNPWSGGNDNSDNSDDNFGDTADSTNGFGLGSVQSFDRANRVLIAHAVIASLVWV
jgi:hypothetical protein